METIKQYVRDHIESIEEVRDIVDYGCIGGGFPPLVYSEDIHTFFDDNYREITSFIDGYADLTGMEIGSIMAMIVTSPDIKQDITRFIIRRAAIEIMSEHIGAF